MMNNELRPAEEAMLELGYDREDMKKPRVGVMNTWADYNPGHLHLKGVAQAVTEGITEAGGIACNFNTINFCDGLQPKPAYALASRDLICNSIEVIARAEKLDAMVLIATCDKNVPAITMAAARVNVPAIIVTGGHMKSSIYDGKLVDFIDVNKTVSAVEEGRCPMAYLEGLIDVACPGIGACNMMGTANTMQIVVETLGMSLPGNATASAVDKSLLRYGREAGKQVIELWKKNICPRDIITEKSVNNAVRMIMAMGGSTNTMYHLPGVASEAGLTCSVWDMFDKASHEVPLLMTIRPVGPYTISDFDRAGGMSALLNEMKEKLDLTGMTITGKTLGENIEGAVNHNKEIIHTLAEPLDNDGGLILCKGNLVPQGAFIKQSAVPAKLHKFRGTAKVFYDQDDAIAALRDGRIEAGNVVFIIYQGAKAGPHTSYAFTTALKGSHLKDDVATVTDGRLSGAASGACFGYASPEAALRGPLCAVQDGDWVNYDIEKRELNIELSDEELQKRMAAAELRLQPKTGWLSIYQRCVGSILKGATLIEDNRE